MDVDDNLAAFEEIRQVNKIARKSKFKLRVNLKMSNLGDASDVTFWDGGIPASSPSMALEIIHQLWQIKLQ